MAGRTGLWHPAFPQCGLDEGELGSFDDLFELFAWIENGDLVEAHNAWFERGIWVNQVVPKLGWPAIRPHQWRCSAAKAAAHALPRGLGDAAAALNLAIQKDDEGALVMKKMSKPRKALKSEWDKWGRQHAPCLLCAATGKVDGVNPETGRKKKLPCGRCSGRGWMGQREDLPEMPTLWHESRELFERLFAYCRIDVLAEEGVSHALPDLSPSETDLYILDQEINERGFALDTNAIDVALTLVDEESVELNAELAELTGGEVTRASQRAKMLRWFAANGLELDDTQADTLSEVIERDDNTHALSPAVRRAVELMRALGKSSTAKYEAMRNWVCPDSRVHGGLLYHGASTGRWTGAGVQPHNFPRGELKEGQDDPEFVWAVLESLDRDFINYEFGSVMGALSSALRGAITAGEGQTLYVADYSSIEARVLLWCAGDEDGLEIFRRGEDIYCDFASSLFNRPITKKDKTERQFGKVGILGLGYQCGKSKFVDVALALGGLVIPEVSDDPEVISSEYVVDAYREKYWRVKEMWWAQEKAAVRAVNFGKVVPCGKVKWYMAEAVGESGDFLYCELPSGRRLAYPEPAIVDKPVPWGGTKPSITYMGVDQYTRKWKRQSAYGGLLVENIVQAISRDIMAEAMVRCAKSGVYAPILSVHDELIAEAAEGTGDVKEFEALLTRLPKWAKGLPIAAEGWTGRRYRK